jgi:DNA polymerase
LHIDIETYSSVPLAQGVYNYTAAPDFAVLLFAYSVGVGEVRCIDLSAPGAELPPEIVRALKDPEVYKYAYNAAFERVCLSAHLGKQLDPAGWRCTMVQAAASGLAGTLDAVAEYLGVGIQKSPEGARLIRRFCIPSDEPHNLFAAQEDAQDWASFIEYCRQDVRVEMAVHAALPPLPDREWEFYALDQRVNDRGVLIDRELAAAAAAMMAAVTDRLNARVREVSGIDNPASLPQLKKWLASRGVTTESLTAEAVRALLAGDLPYDVRQVLEARALTSLSSLKKYQAMMDAAGADGRARGQFKFYGAHTGRWSGRQIQLQNLPRVRVEAPAFAREMVCRGDAVALEVMYGSVPAVLKQLLRTAIVAPEGKLFFVSDFSAIEARVLAWLAGEKWVLDVFRRGGDLYVAAAARMLNVPEDRVSKEQRQQGKVATLALGYQGGPPALKAMGASAMGIPDSALPGIVSAWRAANPRAVKLWKDVQDAALAVIRHGGRSELPRLVFQRTDGRLEITLPGGRQLVYRDARADGQRIVFRDKAAPSRQETFGGRLVENCLSGKTQVLTDTGWKRITAVTTNDLLWDGEKWVSHSGVKMMGVHRVISAHGIRCTPDHLILTREGWKHAAQSEGYNRADPRIPDGYRLLRLERKAHPLAREVPLRNRKAAYEQVYDVINAGNNQRFTVRGGRWKAPVVVHNCVQGIARDLLAEALLRCERAGFRVVMHVHDEAVCEMDDEGAERQGQVLEALNALMAEPVPWAEGLPLGAAGFVTPYYKKD